MIRCAFIGVLLMIICSCANNATKVAKIIGQEISFDAQLRNINKNVALQKNQNTNECVKLLIYYDSLGCNTCRVQCLDDWTKIMMESEKSNGALGVYVIFTPKKDVPNEIPRLLRLGNFSYPIYMDDYGEFYEDNKKVIDDEDGIILLLDKNNKVVLLGNPLMNDAMWNLFKTTLDNMLVHDGIYVPAEKNVTDKH